MASLSQLSNPKPTGGAIRKGAIPSTNVVSRRGGLPSVQSLMNPSIRTSVTELQTNSTAAIPIFAKPFIREWEKDYAEGDILFVKKEDQVGGGSGRGISMHTVCSLPVLNYILRSRKEIGDDGGENEQLYYGGANPDEAKNRILSDFNFLGVMLNDMDGGSQYQRLLNVTVRGRCRVPTYWRHPISENSNLTGITKGDIVWLGLKRINKLNETVVEFTPKKMRETIRQIVPYYYKFVPIVEPKTAVFDPNNLPEWDQCVWRYPIGVVHQLPFKGSPKYRQDNAQCVADEGKLLDRMEVFIRV